MEIINDSFQFANRDGFVISGFAWCNHKYQPVSEPCYLILNDKRWISNNETDKMKAVIAQNKTPTLVSDKPVPKLRDDYILVKTVAVALNPTDWKHATFNLAAEGGLLGCDFAGIVEEVGSKVTKKWQKGERIAGVAHGGNLVQPEDGAFAEHILAKGDIQVKIPDSLSFEDASTLTLGATTVMQGLYQKALKLNLPDNPVKGNVPLLIYGGSTATGSLGIQYAKL